MNNIPLEVENLGHRYGANQVLNNLSFAVSSGEFVAVLGPSGCGKTTLLRSVAGLLIPSEGRLKIQGTTVCEQGRQVLPPEKRRVGLVFQEYALFPNLNVSENIAFGLGRKPGERVKQLLDLVGMPELAKRYPKELSGGQQQRVALARALAPKPHLLLLDEPFANVDTERRDQLGQALRETVKSEGSSVLLVTHDRMHALSLADRVVALSPSSHGGVLGQVGPPEQLYNRPASTEIALLTGPGTLLKAVAQGSIARSVLGEHTIQPDGRGDGHILFRPEWLAFEPQDQGPCTLQTQLFQGDRYQLTVKWGPVDFRLFWTKGPAPAEGTPGRLHFKAPGWFMPSP